MKIGELLTTRIKGAQKAIIGGAAHLLNMEKPKEFNQIVTKFLKEV
jgi:pimeloyl-ACP methyl ester carboxylesterase